MTEPRAYYKRLDQLQVPKYAWRFFIGPLMIGGWVLSEAQHQEMLVWAQRAALVVTPEE
jgi:hypothetical protein